MVKMVVRTFSNSRILDHTTGSHCLSVPRPIEDHVVASEDEFGESSWREFII